MAHLLALHCHALHRMWVSDFHLDKPSMTNLLVLHCHVLHSEWVSDFHLLISSSYLTFLPSIAMLFTVCEFLTFTCWSALLGLPSCSPLQCSSQHVSFWLSPADQPSMAHLLALHCHALYSKWVSHFHLLISAHLLSLHCHALHRLWVSDFHLLISPLWLTSLPFPLPCSSQRVSFWLTPVDHPSMAHLLALHCHALHRMWVSDFHLLISPPCLTSLPSIAMLFTGCEFLTFTCWWALHGSPPCPPLQCSSQYVSFWLSPADQSSMAHLHALHGNVLHSLWVSDFHLLISPPWLTSLPSIAMLCTGCEFLTFTCWSAIHGSPPCPPLPCSSQDVSFWLSLADQPSMAHLLALHCHALHSGWVSDFHLLISPPWLTSLPFIAMLFTVCEFLTFTCWSALHGSPPCPSLPCSSQNVSFWLSPADQASIAHLLALHCHALHSKWVSDFHLLISRPWLICPPLPCSSQFVSFWLSPADQPSLAYLLALHCDALHSMWVSGFHLLISPPWLTSLPSIAMLFTECEFLTFTWISRPWLTSLPCSSQRVSFWLSSPDLHSPPCPPLPCSSQAVSFWLLPADQPSMAHLLALHCHALHSEWVSDFHLLISPPWLTSLPSIAMFFTGCEFLTFTCWSALHGSPLCPPMPCSSQLVSFWLSPADQPSMAHLLALHCHGLHRMWVSDFHLLISPQWLNSLPSIAMLFTGCEFLTFTCWSALNGSPPCPPLSCSPQDVSFWLLSADQPFMAHLLALHCHALYSEWVSDFHLLISCRWLISSSSIAMLFTASEFLTFTCSSVSNGSPLLLCSSQLVSIQDIYTSLWLPFALANFLHLQNVCVVFSDMPPTFLLSTIFSSIYLCDFVEKLSAPML